MSNQAAKVIVHEIGHHLMRARVAPALYGVDGVICTRQDNRAKRHKMAQQLEREITE